MIATLWERYCILFDAGEYTEAAIVYAAYLKAKAEEETK